MSELIKSSASITTDPVTGVRSLVSPTNEINLDKEVIDRCINEGLNPSDIIEEKILNGELSGLQKEAIEILRLSKKLKSGEIKKVKLQHLPKSIQNMARQRIGDNEKLLNQFAHEFAMEQIKEISNSLNYSQTFKSEDLDTGEVKSYDDTLKEQLELFKKYGEMRSNMTEDIADSRNDWDVYKDAFYYETLEKISESKIPRANKIFKNRNRYLTSYKFMYNNTKLESTDPELIPIVLKRHMELNKEDLGSLDDDVYEWFLTILMYHIYIENYTIRNVLDHVYMSRSVLGIVELDMLKIDGDIYKERIQILFRILKNIENNYL